MKRFIITIITLLVLAGSTFAFSPRKKQQVIDATYNYISAYKLDEYATFDVCFGNCSGDGECYTYVENGKIIVEITYSNSTWNSMTKNIWLDTIAHEIAHAACDIATMKSGIKDTSTHGDAWKSCYKIVWRNLGKLGYEANGYECNIHYDNMDYYNVD